ncbi:hypothetical protein Hdeb2414_s0789g00947141 [Helianthus debilis subsp. tardiflorus]
MLCPLLCIQAVAAGSLHGWLLKMLLRKIRVNFVSFLGMLLLRWGIGTPMNVMVLHLWDSEGKMLLKRPL